MTEPSTPGSAARRLRVLILYANRQVAARIEDVARVVWPDSEIFIERLVAVAAMAAPKRLHQRWRNRDAGWQTFVEGGVGLDAFRPRSTELRQRLGRG